jgi:hypothetical protein
MAATDRASADNCRKIRELGFTTSRHINMYGEHFELVSDPFDEGEYTAVRALSETDQTIRTIRLPVALLMGVADRFPKQVDPGGARPPPASPGATDKE